MKAVASTESVRLGLSDKPGSEERVPRRGSTKRWRDVASLAESSLEAVEHYCSQWSAGRLVSLSAAAVVLVGVVDYVTGPELSFSVFYLLPITCAAWFAGKRSGLAIAAFSALVWLIADMLTLPSERFPVALWNASSRVCIFLFVAWLLAHVRKLHNQLEETIRSRTAQLEAELARGQIMGREIAAISHREQRRIAHELHDGLGQELGALAFQAKLLATNLAESGTPLSADAERLVSLLNLSVGRTRALSQLLDPVGSDSGGLRQALSQLADHSGRAFAVACTFTAPDILPELPRESELHLYRIAQEAIHNAVGHGEASAVSIAVGVSPRGLTLSIADNGRGFDARSTQADPPGGMGLRIMRHRAAALGAQLEINSQPSCGCTVSCLLSAAPSCG